MLPAYERLYAGRAYLGKPETGPLQRHVAELRRRFDVRDRRTVRLEDTTADTTGPVQLELPLAPGEEAPAGLVA